ncbi:MAG: class I SAM-dependent methyltransferase [Candidatus Omnitrophica bacterium]|nr:class I SAM-dependent methyltransferase [Candidatus Omnitrophota bacterium]
MAAAAADKQKNTLLADRTEDIIAALSAYEHPGQVWDNLMRLRGRFRDPVDFDLTELWKILQPNNARFFWYGGFDLYEKYIPEIVEAKRKRFYPGLSASELEKLANTPMAAAKPAGNFNRSPYRPRGEMGSSRITNFDRRGMDEFEIQFNFEVTANISRRVERGERPRILVLGAGRGKLSYDLWKRYRDKVEIYSVNKEDNIGDLIYDVPGLVNIVQEIRAMGRDEPPVSPALAEEALQAIRRNFVSADVHRLDFPDRYFDIVIVPNGTFIYFADKLMALEQLRRVLKPSGDGFAVDIEYFDILDKGFESFFNGIGEEFFAARQQQNDRNIFSLHFRNTNPAFTIPLDLVSTQELKSNPRAYIPGMIRNRFRMVAPGAANILPARLLPLREQSVFRSIDEAI